METDKRLATSIPFLLIWVAKLVMSLVLKTRAIKATIVEVTLIAYQTLLFSIFAASYSSSFLPTFRCSGCLLTYSLGSQLNWKIIAMGATLVPFSAMIVAFFVPESPTFLVQKVNRVSKFFRWPH